MFSLSIENSSGDIFPLTGIESKYKLVNIEGLAPPQAQINLTNIAGMDGARFNSAKLQTRNIVLTVFIVGDIITNRRNLYNAFRTKERVKLYYTNAGLDVYIEGYVDSVECNMFSKSEKAQISIICPYPYFKSAEQIVSEISNELALFVFPFSINEGDPIPFSEYEQARVTNIYNASETATGLEIEIDVIDDISKIEIKNTITGDSIILNYSFIADDRITIDTGTGNKSIKLNRGGVITNLFSALQIGSVFIQLMPGDNQFGYLVDNGANDDNVYILFRYSNLYRGV